MAGNIKIIHYSYSLRTVILHVSTHSRDQGLVREVALVLRQWISPDICPLELAENVPLLGVGACYRGCVSPETLTTEPPKGGVQRSFYLLCIEEANATKGEHQESWEVVRSMWSEYTGNKKKIFFLQCLSTTIY